MTAPGASPWFSEEHAMLREQLRRFVTEEIRPHADAWERDGFVPRELLRSMGALGFFGILIPEELGGLGLGAFEYCLVAEELAKLPQILSINLVTGAKDIEILLAVHEFSELSDFLLNDIAAIRGIRSLSPAIAVDTVKFDFDVAPLS